MEFNSIKTEKFKSIGLSLIHQTGEILIFVQYPFRAGDKDFFLIDSNQDFRDFLADRKPKDSVTIFKTFKTLKEGLVTHDFIKEALMQLKLIKSADCLVILSRQEKYQTKKWSFSNSESELNEVLHDNLGQSVKILEEPDWLDDNKVIHGYEPDEDGQIRPGAY